MTTRNVPLLAAALLSAAAISVPAAAQGATQARQCGSAKTANGGRAQQIKAQKTTCKTARAVARRANGKRSYKASGFSCRSAGPVYSCFKAGTTQAVLFAYKKPA